jgi:ribosomal protein S4
VNIYLNNREKISYKKKQLKEKKLQSYLESQLQGINSPQLLKCLNNLQIIQERNHLK